MVVVDAKLGGLDVVAAAAIRKFEIVLLEEPWQEMKEKKAFHAGSMRVLLNRLYEAVSDDPVQAEGLGLDWVLHVMGRLTSCYWSVRGVSDPVKPYAKMHGSGGYVSSLFNHSCDPNLEFFCPLLPNQKSSARWGFTATRDIQKGESLRVSYMGEIRRKGKKERQDWLHSLYGFVCQAEI